MHILRQEINQFTRGREFERNDVQQMGKTVDATIVDLNVKMKHESRISRKQKRNGKKSVTHDKSMGKGG